MAQGIPSWMNAEFTQGVLRRSEQDDSIEVIDIHWKPATNKGDNYTSDMFRIYVEMARKKGDKRITEKKSLILKVAPTNEGGKKELIEKSNIFDTEMSMMTDTLKKMNELTGPNHRFNATAYYIRREAPASLLVEDLAPLGFRMADRQSGLDLDHCILVMRNIARFHASSAVVCQRDPAQKEIYNKGMFNDEYPDEIRMFFNSGARQLADEVEKWPELGPKYAEKIRKLSDTLYIKGMEVTKPREDEFNVINHGDSWVNNMLFRYNDQGKPVDHIFVDFQMSIFTTPAVDLHYFLATSPQPKIFEQNKQLLLEEYLSTLTSSLKEYRYKGAAPHMSELQRYLREREMYALISSFTVLPACLVDKDKVLDLDEILHNEQIENSVDFQLSYYTSPAIDLQYFLATSPQPKVAEERRQDLLEEYFRTLTSSLKEYGYKGAAPSMEELQSYLREREIFALISSLAALPLVIMEKDKALDLDDIVKPDGSYDNPAFKGDAYRKLMTKRLPYFEECGLLD